MARSAEWHEDYNKMYLVQLEIFVSEYFYKKLVCQ
jgi:hypothetical protein